ncbi:MAG: N-acetylmuramoyl-L-alanine amidase [Burkholderiales bacterium]|nr:N-acetylmuramoyl-L-alanine amidase [Burkholderiales bacterium]
MLNIDSDGMIVNDRVHLARRLAIEKAKLETIHGLIVHQTGAPTAGSSLESYRKPGANGAHLLIDRDGTLYQTASLYRQTWHVGKLKTRCLAEHRCSAVETRLLKSFNPFEENRREMRKSVPGRYPANVDSIGIELVGGVDGSGVYDPVTTQQNEALSWLVRELMGTFHFAASEIFRHPVVSRKTPSEAETARW